VLTIAAFAANTELLASFVIIERPWSGKTPGQNGCARQGLEPEPAD
jgi:hypothetical protein